MENLIESEEKEPKKLTEEAESDHEEEPQEAERDTHDSEPNWPLRGVLILIAAGIIVGLIFLARWIYHLTQNNTAGSKPSNSQSQNAGKSASNNNPIIVGGGQSNGGQKSTAPSSKGGQKLPNNGPGNVIGIFAAASFAAGALHYIIKLRKSAQED